jgi:8-oxo-dGTP pyrophosphatase MutT (NUDIX family)
MSDENPYKILGTKTVYKNPWIRVREDKVVQPSGKDGIYGVVESDDSVMVAALNENNEVYVIRTFNYPDASWNWELPGGGGDGEDAVVASQRELVEETGILAEDWELLGKTRVCNGLMTERMYTYLARNLTLNSTASTKDENDEAIIGEGKFVSIAEVHEMIAAGEINDSQSMTGLYLLEQWLSKQ